MKSRPLKNKYKKYAKGLWYDKIAKERMSQEATEIFDDIREARDWFKENFHKKLNKMKVSSGLYTKISVAFLSTLDKAFEDLK